MLSFYYVLSTVPSAGDLDFLAEVSSPRTGSPNAGEPKAKGMGSTNSEQ